MLNMNCQELQSYFESHSHMDAGVQLASDVAEHIAVCAECCRLVEGQKELDASLRLMRESAPPVPASLDATVLANYRRRATVSQTSEGPSRWGAGFVSWRLGAVAVTLLILATIFSLRKSSVTTKTGPPTHPPVVARMPQPAPPEGARPEVVRKNTVAAQRPERKKLDVDATTQTSAAVSPDRLDDTFPDGFRSLMYCDELSCDGGMEVLRVQLPSPAAGFMPASASGGRVVSADVLVGADGFARGIRIVH
jgi:hypothetical protein